MEYQIKPTGTWMDKVNGNWLDPSNINYISENYSNNLRTQNAFDNHIIEDGWNKDSDGKYRKNVYTTDDRFLDFNDTFKILNPLIDSTTFLANSIKDSKENKEFNRKRNASTFNYNYNPNETGINNVPVYYQNGGGWLDKMQKGGKPNIFDYHYTSPYLDKKQEEVYVGELFRDVNNLPSGYNNPGNLRPRGKSKGFRSFPNPQEGYKALVEQVDLYKSGNSTTGIIGESTLLELMNKYAPKRDNNNPSLYAKFISDNLGVSVHTPISQIDSNKLADLITIMENNPSYKRNINRKQNGGWLDNTPLYYQKGGSFVDYIRKIKETKRKLDEEVDYYDKENYYLEDVSKDHYKRLIRRYQTELNSLLDDPQYKQYSKDIEDFRSNYRYQLPFVENTLPLPVRRHNGGWLDHINDTGYTRGTETARNPYNIIPSNSITMKNVDYPIYGVDDLGNEKIMFPENDYLFEGNFVYEKPIN